MYTVKFNIIAATVFLLLTAVSLSGAVRRSGLYDREALVQDVNLDVETKHQKWAKPLIGGPVKALFIGPMYGHRETAELAQRMSLEFDTIFAGTMNKWQQYGSLEGYSKVSDVLDRLREKMKNKYEVIVIGNLEWSLFPDDVVLSIFEQVANGTGLVYVTYTQQMDSEILNLLDESEVQFDYNQSVPLSEFLGLQDKNKNKALISLPAIKSYSLNKGKILIVNYPGKSGVGVHYLTPDPYDELTYEYCQSLLAKIILDAANRPKPLQINKIECRENIKADNSEYNRITAYFSGDLDDYRNITAQWIVRDVYGGRILSEQVFVKERQLTISLPVLSSGVHFIDVFLKVNDEIADWSSISFTVFSPYWISDIDFLKQTLIADQKIAGQVMVSKVPDNGYVLLRLIDNCNREFACVKLPDKNYVEQLYTFYQPANIWFNLPVADSLTTINTARAEIWDGSNMLAVFEKEFYVPKKPENDFLIGVWGNAERLSQWSRIQSLLAEHEKNQGIDLELVGHYYSYPQKHIYSVAGLARANMFAYPYVDRISYFKSDRVRKPCLSDPNFLNYRLGQLTEWATELKKFGCFGYNLGDENNLSAAGIDVCISPTCLKNFHNYLKLQYSSLDALNTQWQSNYQSWDEIIPPTRSEALKLPNMSPWIDHKVFMTNVMMDYMSKASEAIKQGDSAAKCGPEGIWGSSPYFGFDWQQLADRFEIVFPYSQERAAFHSARSLCGSDILTGIWAGGYPPVCLNESMQRYDPWMALLYDMKTLWFYSAYDGTETMTCWNAFAPDFRFNRMGVWFFEEVDLIKQGIGKLIRNSKRDNNGIALLFSQVSSYLNSSAKVNDMIDIVIDAGYQFDLITTKQLDNGDLSKFKCLILPDMAALSQNQSQAIRDFVYNGGVVIADGMCAVYDSHGKALEQSGLADVFGYADSTSSASSSADMLDIPDIAEIEIEQSTKIDTDESRQTAQNDIKPADIRFVADTNFTTKIDGQGVFSHRNFGDGIAICMNIDIKGYGDEREFGRMSIIPQMLHTMLASKNITPSIKVKYHNTKVNCLPGIEVINYNFKGGSVISLLRNELSAIENPPVEAEIELEQLRHIYQFGTGKYLGYKNIIDVTVNPGRPIVLFALDKNPGELNVELSSKRYTQGETLDMIISMDNIGTNAANVKIIDPTGRKVQCYTRNVIFENGRSRYIKPLALNDTAGVWEAVVSDVLTGGKKRLTFEVVNGTDYE